MYKYLSPIVATVILISTLTPVFAKSDFQVYTSKEIGPCLTSGGNPKACDPTKQADADKLQEVEDLQAKWLTDNTKICSEAVVSGNFLDDNTIEFITNEQKISASISLRDMNLDDISSLNNLGTKSNTQGVLTTSTTATMQDFAPKPLSRATQPYWTENSGSNSSNSRNAILFEFFDNNGNPFTINSFGAWFGDIETRSDVLPAIMRVYNSTGQAVSENIEILENTDTNLALCGSTSGIGVGCGNHTTRWIGFTQQGSSEIQKVLIVVGEDDTEGDGSREHLSFIGASIAINSNCPSISSTTTPIPTTTSVPTPTPTTQVQATITPTPTTSPIHNTPSPTLPINNSKICEKPLSTRETKQKLISKPNARFIKKHLFKYYKLLFRHHR